MGKGSIAGWVLGSLVFILTPARVPHALQFAVPAAPNPGPLLTRALERVHSHNDYVQRRPLYDALDQNFYSVEADVWMHRDSIQVSHLGFFFKGTLEELYLRPLQGRVDRLGSVYGDGQPFYLWIDIKDGSQALRDRLNGVLNRYPMLTRFSDHETFPRGPVTVILTGDENSKQRFVAEFPLRRACRDAERFNETDPPADSRWSWYSIEWSDWMRGFSALRALSAGVHAKGKKLRLWDVPESEGIWAEALRANVDQVSVDDLPWMRKFLEALTRARPAG